jgi:hypothetical protein
MLSDEADANAVRICGRGGVVEGLLKTCGGNARMADLRGPGCMSQNKIGQPTIQMI